MRKKYTLFRPRIKSRHPSHDTLRNVLELLPFKSVIRFGSPTEMSDTVRNGGNRVELNTTEAIQNSSDKLLMKKCFSEWDVKTADWWTVITPILENVEFNKEDYDGENGVLEATRIDELSYPIIAKHRRGSRGRGNYKLNSKEELVEFLSKPGRKLSNYIFEKFYNYNREYRLHVTKEGYFYSCRKMLKSDCPKEKRWFRNDSNSVWVVEENDLFDKPSNWENIVEESIVALDAVGLDFGAVDIKVQSSKNKDGKNRENPNFIIIEINSAPSFGKITEEKYKEILPNLLKRKYNE